MQRVILQNTIIFMQADSAIRLFSDRIHTVSLLVRNSQLSTTSSLLRSLGSMARSEEEARQKESEEQSLYQYRTKTHVIEEDGDLLEKELQSISQTIAIT